MRYVIVCVIKGEAGDFNNYLRMELYEKFKAKSSKLPAHFTIKAPFEYDGKIDELEKNIEKFCANEKKTTFTMKTYDHFDNRVIYMSVNMSREGKKVHDRLIDLLSKFSYMSFDKNDGKNKKFHVTLASKKLPPKYDEVWKYVNSIPFDFNCNFDNITIYNWKNNNWEKYKEFLFRK